MAKQIDSTNKTAKREMAQRLYVDSNYTQEEVASIIGVTRQTIIRWSREHHWQELKAATSVSPAEQIRQLRQQIANINAGDSLLVLLPSDGQRQPKQTHLTSSPRPSPSSKKT